MPRIGSFRDPGERYGVLRAMSTACLGLGTFLIGSGGLVLALGLSGLGGELVRPVGDSMARWIAVVWSFGLIVSGIQSLALGAFLRLAIHVEENTRATAQALDRLGQAGTLKPEVDVRSIFLS